jgi:hypothetical protein
MGFELNPYNRRSTAQVSVTVLVRVRVTRVRARVWVMVGDR